jgi:penicillin amidase
MINAAVVLSALALAVTGCELVAPFPRATTLADRLAVFPREGVPVERPITIHWDEHQIPFIDAETDGDLAFALGMVHAHLRLGQMETIRRAAQGRLAEMVGPIAADIDHALRIVNFGRAAKAIETAMPSETRRWIERFVEGINFYQQRAAAPPLDYRLLGIEPEPWTVADVLTVGRLVGTDVNWLVWISNLKFRAQSDWPERWARLLRNGTSSVPSFEAPREVAILNELLAGLSRSGSNSVAISGDRSTTGGAIIASDPHLGIMIPNTWLVAGVRSPSYHAVGLMAPGLPFIAVGRNRDIAWGGTNMRAASSDLFAQSDLGPEAFVTRSERIKVRWWFDRDVTVRETAIGPVLSDAAVIEAREGEIFALRWVGHQATDEITAFLKANRASGWQEFRDAFANYGVPAQNMIYADTRGRIGQLMAVKLPIRDNRLPEDIVLDPERDEWRGYLGTGELPFDLNPADGVIASANNRPVAALDVPVGYFFSSSDRVRRLNALLRGRDKLGIEDFADLQRDVYSASAAALNARLVAAIGVAGLGETAGEKRVVAALAAWDGHYASESKGALAFEIFVRHFIDAFYAARSTEAEVTALAGSGRVFEFVTEDMEDRDGDVPGALAAALGQAAPRFGEFANWGEMHRLDLGHPLANIPVIGSRFWFADLAAAGSRETVMKTAHSISDARHSTRYGSNSRHISDLSDPDENYFVLLGGQDGWFGSSTLIDQVPLWREGRYVRVPLTLEAVRDSFPHQIVLQPEPPA